MHSRVLVVALVLALVVTQGWPCIYRARAQEDPIDLHSAIPECTPEQAAEVRELVLSSGIIDDLFAASDRLALGSFEDRYTIIADTDAHQQRWWAEIVPDLPDCAFAQRAIQIIGRYIDEFMLSNALLQMGRAMRSSGNTALASRYLTMADAHLATAMALSGDLSLLITALYDTGDV